MEVDINDLTRCRFNAQKCAHLHLHRGDLCAASLCQSEVFELDAAIAKARKERLMSTARQLCDAATVERAEAIEALIVRETNHK